MEDSRIGFSLSPPEPLCRILQNLLKFPFNESDSNFENNHASYIHCWNISLRYFCTTCKTETEIAAFLDACTVLNMSSQFSEYALSIIQNIIQFIVRANMRSSHSHEACSRFFLAVASKSEQACNALLSCEKDSLYEILNLIFESPYSNANLKSANALRYLVASSPRKCFELGLTDKILHLVLCYISS